MPAEDRSRFGLLEQPPVPRLIVLISGAGAKLQALIDAIAAGELRATIVLVVSNRNAAKGVERARQAGIPALVFPLAPYRERGRECYDADLAERLLAFRPDVIVSAGWMHIFSPAFLQRVTCRIINVHPALPGMFPGARCLEDAFEAYQQRQIEHSGCMVHELIEALDAGPVIAEAVVPILATDTYDDFECRMQLAEQKLIVAGVAKVLSEL